jgi:hypothetical protein
MKNLAPLSLALSLAIASLGCANSLVGDEGEGSGSGSGSGSNEPTPSLDATGTYRLHSTFDIATNMPGTTGSIVNGLIEATDDPNDPMLWVLDQLIAQMDPGTLKTLLQGAAPFVAAELNAQVTNLAPGLVATLTKVGQGLADVTKNFGVREQLVVSHVDQTYIAQITADGLRLRVDGQLVELAFADHGLEDIVVNDVLVALEIERFAIGEHVLPMSYGRVLRVAFDAAVVPSVDPNAKNLGELLVNAVNCPAVGQAISNALGFGGATLWATACVAGLHGAANVVYDQIADLDQPLDFHLVGTARAIDHDHDYRVDKLDEGVWSGTLVYDTVSTPLASPATFAGTRM